MSPIYATPSTLRVRSACFAYVRSVSKLTRRRKLSEEKYIDDLVGLFHRSAAFPPLFQTSSSSTAADVAAGSVDFAAIGASGSSPKNMDEYLVARLASYRKARQLLPSDSRSTPGSRFLGSIDLDGSSGDSIGESASTAGPSRWQPFDGSAAARSSISSDEARLRGLRIIDALHGTEMTLTGQDNIGAQLALDWAKAGIKDGKARAQSQQKHPSPAQASAI